LTVVVVDFVAVAVLVELAVAFELAVSELVDLVADPADVAFLAAVSGFVVALEGEDDLVMTDLVAVAFVEAADAFAVALGLAAVADEPDLVGAGVDFAFADLVLAELLAGAVDEDLAAVGADLAGLAVAEETLLDLVAAGAADADLVGAALGDDAAALADLVIGAVVGALTELAAAFGLVVVADVDLLAGLAVEAVIGAEATLGAAVDVWAALGAGGTGTVLTGAGPDLVSAVAGAATAAAAAAVGKVQVAAGLWCTSPDSSSAPVRPAGGLVTATAPGLVSAASVVTSEVSLRPPIGGKALTTRGPDSCQAVCNMVRECVNSLR
jgi:hypothetical protein